MRIVQGIPVYHILLTSGKNLIQRKNEEYKEKKIKWMDLDI